MLEKFNFFVMDLNDRNKGVIGGEIKRWNI